MAIFTALKMTTEIPKLIEKANRTLHTETVEKLGQFFRTFAGSVRPLLLLDYDGTLAPFHVDRFQARPWAGVRELLQDIREQGRTDMVVITGRPAVEIAPLLGLTPALEVWGLHGTERLYTDGRRELEQLPAAAREALDALRVHLKRDSFGGLFEDKDNGAVMHWRGASPEQAAEIERRTRALFEPLAELEGLSLLKFEAGLELRGGRNKGGAAAAILAEMESNGPIAFLGDDVTDEHAFEVINGSDHASGRPHLTALVRPEWRQTAADVWLRPPEDLKQFLSRWLQACGAE